MVLKVPLSQFLHGSFTNVMSTKEKDILKIILSEFPDLTSEISSRYYNSSSFLEACEDYAVCFRSIQKLESEKGTDIEEELKELRAALAELKEEILLNINSH